jgi:hypothetical protein
MREANKHQPWTLTDIGYIQANHGKLTCKMMAQDLGRTEKAIETRVKILRVNGQLSPERIPTGRRAGSVRMESHHATEIDALRTEAASYLAFLVKEKGFAPDLAILIARKLKAHLAMPAEYVIPRLNKPVQEWVEELAA